ncbi:hypothetical protein Tco_0200952 [Tanacetum coccineum]
MWCNPPHQSTTKSVFIDSDDENENLFDDVVVVYASTQGEPQPNGSLSDPNPLAIIIVSSSVLEEEEPEPKRLEFSAQLFSFGQSDYTPTPPISSTVKGKGIATPSDDYLKAIMPLMEQGTNIKEMNKNKGKADKTEHGIGKSTRPTVPSDLNEPARNLFKWAGPAHYGISPIESP